MDKASLRTKHLNLRQINQRHLSKLNQVITLKCLSQLEKYHSIGIYVSKEYEVDTRLILESLFKQNKIVCVPKIIDHRMVFIQIKGLNECAPSSFGILEPLSNQGYPNLIEVMVIPMLAYQKDYHRLGWGLGYYDHYLKDYQGYKLGLCFKMNEEPLLIPSAHDIACDTIITED